MQYRGCQNLFKQKGKLEPSEKRQTYLIIKMFLFCDIGIFMKAQGMVFEMGMLSK